MLFSSYEFILLFLPITFIIYHICIRLEKYKLAIVALVLASLFYYGYWKPIYLFLILGLTIFNYYWASVLINQQKSKLLLAIGICINLGFLFFFKYFIFAVSTINSTFNTHIPIFDIVLPLGISFYIFQMIAYLVDSHEGKVIDRDFLHFLLFISFFPQLIAGPIVHHKEMMPQFANKNIKNIKVDLMCEGIYLFCIGLFKKVVIADSLAPIVAAGFDGGHALAWYQAWLISFSYTFQLYFDFSGYTDMAIGAAKIFGINIPINFNSPYKAVNIQDFWRRWHMTLSRWLRDYLYIPLGGNRSSKFKHLRNLFLTFFLGGIWHGAGWTFVIWGAMHGAATIVHTLWVRANYKLPPWAGFIITFLFVNFAWVFFRAKDLSSANFLLKNMFHLNWTKAAPIGFSNKELLLINLAAAVICFALPNSMELTTRHKDWWFAPFYAGICFITAFLYFNRVGAFIYFNF